MKNRSGVLVVSLILSACGTVPGNLTTWEESHGGNGGNGNNVSAGDETSDLNAPLDLANLPTEVYPLTDQQKSDILFLFEEEKMAHDLYTVLAEKWGVNAFTHIAAAEQHHVDALAALVDKYDLTLPAGWQSPGVFDNPTLQEQYSKLRAQGEISETEARTMGVTLETQDLADIEARQAGATPDVTYLLQRLHSASEKHLKALTNETGSRGNGQQKGKGQPGNGMGGKGKMKRGG